MNAWPANCWATVARRIASFWSELAVDLGVLFDRRVPHSLVFPTPACIAGVLQRLNDKELAHLWQEDETIGWLYQYFNSREEIDRMRKKELGGSPSPRNSRELAVRNQFFTPRYVVEFLTDNTLGRIWYEMQRGATVLKDECRYLVRRPHEIFLGPDEQPPATESVNTDLPQEELLQRPVYILHRARKDPRDLKILDPACGSGHFLLYAFDLLEHIYIEAWQDASAPASEITGKSLRDESDYKTEQALLSAIPGLIMQHNLHGIDIDPRACQIAALSLWLRAQRSYQKLGLKASERPPITKINVVCAEPMPGEEDFLEEFIAKELSHTPEQEAIVHRILSVGAPHTIILFGSQARGDARSDSDLDLLIIEDSDLPRYKRSVPYLRALVGLFPAKDVVVWTPAEVQEWAAVPHAFITTALREGKILYAR
jgi:predicted nucleotidyltransferase